MGEDWDGYERRRRRESWEGKHERRKEVTKEAVIEKKNGLIVTSKMIATVAVCLGLLISIGNLYGARVLADNQTSVNTQKIVELSQTDKNIADLLGLMQRQIAVNENKIDNVKTDVTEIKADLKAIKFAVKA